MVFTSRLFAASTALFLSAAALLAQEGAGPRLSIELNSVRGVESGCELSFLAVNSHPRDIESAVFEAVLFDTGGQVDRLTLLDFGALPAGRPRVRQFVLTGATCEGLGRLLINGATECEAGELGGSACAGDLDLSTRTDIEVIG